MKTKLAILVLTSLTLILAYFKPETSLIASSAIEATINYFGTEERLESHGKPKE